MKLHGKKKNLLVSMISVLYVDDEPALLNVSKIYLERRSDISVTIARSVSESLNLLKTNDFDVIISDYQMPGTNGIGFLKILKDQGCPVPFILFTGRGREEIVIEAINNGATYYIQKGGDPKSQFAELDHKIREASRRYKAEKGLQHIEICYATLFEHSGTAITMLDRNLTIRQANKEFFRLTGYASSEVIGSQQWADLVGEDDSVRLRDLFQCLRQGLTPDENQFHASLVRKDGTLRVISATAAQIPTTGCSIISFVDIMQFHPPEENVQKNSPGPGSFFRQCMDGEGREAENA